MRHVDSPSQHGAKEASLVGYLDGSAEEGLRAFGRESQEVCVESVVSSEVRVDAGKAAAVVVARGVQKRYGEGIQQSRPSAPPSTTCSMPGRN